MEAWIRDMKFGAKVLLREKGFTAACALTLAVAIGANVAVFTIVRSVLLKPLPYADADRILFLHNSYPNAGVATASNSVPDLFDRRREVESFEELALYRYQGFTVGEPGSTRRVRGMRVSPSLFRLLGVSPHRGRSFAEEEGEIGNESKAILTYGLWQELYGGSEDAVGREIRVNGVSHSIVGVLAERFSFLSPEVRLFVPAAFTPEEKSDESRHSNSWWMVGRLGPGATRERAQAEVDALNERNLERFPEMAEITRNSGFHSVVLPLQEQLTLDVRATLYLLWGAVGFVLLIAAVNTANLVLVRSQARLKELAIRSSMGAGRMRIARQLVVEMVLVTLLAGALGLAIGAGALHSLRSFGIESLPRGSEIELDPGVVAAAFAAALVLGASLSLIPVLRMLRMNPSDVVREEGRSSTGGRPTAWLRKALVVSQIALALVLLIAAGLLLASFRRVLAIDPGFRAGGLVTASVSLPAARYPEEPAILSFHDRALAGIRELPGVEEAGMTTVLPFGGSYEDSVILAEGYQPGPGESLISPSRSEVSPGYFEAMGIGLVRGRFIEEADDENTRKVIVIDERLARKFWPGADPVGKRMYTPSTLEDMVSPGENVTWYDVVGVAASIRERGLVEGDDRVGAYYFPLRQSPSRFFTFAVRTGRAPEAIVSEMRGVVEAIDPEIPLFDVMTMEERLDQSLLTRKTSLLLSASFGFAALFLAAVGIYGVLAYLVARRTREIGIRMALGSTTGKAFRLVLREGATLVAIGLGAGLAGSLALGGLVQKQLYGVGAAQPTVLATVSAILAAVALAAATLPALRAARVDPLQALRGE